MGESQALNFRVSIADFGYIDKSYTHVTRAIPAIGGDVLFNLRPIDKYSVRLPSLDVSINDLGLVPILGLGGNFGFYRHVYLDPEIPGEPALYAELHCEAGFGLRKFGDEFSFVEVAGTGGMILSGPSGDRDAAIGGRLYAGGEYERQLGDRPIAGGLVLSLNYPIDPYNDPDRYFGIGYALSL